MYTFDCILHNVCITFLSFDYFLKLLARQSKTNGENKSRITAARQIVSPLPLRSRANLRPIKCRKKGRDLRMRSLYTPAHKIQRKSKRVGKVQMPTRNKQSARARGESKKSRERKKCTNACKREREREREKENSDRRQLEACK